ncbi:transposase family protein [Rothia nasimurium]|uniref:transposase family protein n=1 Tax=Rothia nasimurium TaxID=85336 RepID=UPI0034DFB781
MPHQRTNGLTATQFATLITALANHLTWVKPAEKPRRLTLAQALKITLISYRHNLTQEALAHLFDISQPHHLADHQNHREGPRKGSHSTSPQPRREPESTWLSRD